MDLFPILHTKRLDLIEIQQSHLNDIFRLFEDEEVTRFYNLLPLKEEQEGQKLLDWFRNRYQEGLGIRWGIALKANPLSLPRSYLLSTGMMQLESRLSLMQYLTALSTRHIRLN